jgi:hypothetical protein
MTGITVPSSDSSGLWNTDTKDDSANFDPIALTVYNGNGGKYGT